MISRHLLFQELCPLSGHDHICGIAIVAAKPACLDVFRVLKTIELTIKGAV